MLTASSAQNTTSWVANESTTPYLPRRVSLFHLDLLITNQRGAVSTSLSYAYSFARSVTFLQYRTWFLFCGTTPDEPDDVLRHVDSNDGYVIARGSFKLDELSETSVLPGRWSLCETSSSGYCCVAYCPREMTCYQLPFDLLFRQQILNFVVHGCCCGGDLT